MRWQGCLLGPQNLPGYLLIVDWLHWQGTDTAVEFSVLTGAATICLNLSYLSWCRPFVGYNVGLMSDVVDFRVHLRYIFHSPFLTC